MFSPLNDAEIKGGVILTIFLEILKAIFNKDPTVCMTVVKKSFIILEELDDKTKGTEYLETIIRYIMSARSDLEFSDVYNAAKEISAEGSEIVMTIAEKLINEGMLNAKSETAMNLLTKKFGVLPDDIKIKIQQADADTINRILDNIFDLASLAEVQSYLQKH